MTRATTVLLAALVLLPDYSADDDEDATDVLKEDTKKLQGSWQVTKWVDQSEEPASADEIKQFTFEFKGDRLILKNRKEDDGKEMKYTLDPSKDPKGIDLDMGKVSAGIYKVDGDKLTICVVGGERNCKAAPRPTEFKARKKEKFTLFELKRIKK